MSDVETHAFENFMQRVLNQPVQVPRCKACGAPGPAICKACQRVHDYAVEVEQRRSSSPTARSA